MKTKLLLAAALIGAATLSANAGIRFGFSLGLPLPVVAPVVSVAPIAPFAPEVVAPQVVAVPPVVVAAPLCPGPDYIWAPGYWSVTSYGRVWVSGAWRFGGRHYAYGYVGRGFRMHR